MKTLLVLSPHPETAETIRSGLNPAQYRVIHRAQPEASEPLLAHGLAHACLLDLELEGVQGLWTVERLRRSDARCPIIIYSGAKPSEWEEEAYLRGVSHVLAKPIRPRLLAALLDRLLASPPAGGPASVAPAAASPPTEFIGLPATSFGAGASAPALTHAALRNFSSVLTHSLNAEALLRQFLQQLREIVGLNRAVIFLRQPDITFGAATTPENARRLHAAGSIGLSTGLFEHFEMSLDAGIGGQLQRLGRMLRRDSNEVRGDVEARKEFELLGGQVAIPILDRESLLGAAVLDARITGEPLTNAELELVFHLLEPVGLAVRNIWLHDQVTANNEMLAGVLRELNSACVVVSRDLQILHANKMARKCFGQAARTSGEMEFADLPQLLGAKVYQVLRTGAGITPFRYEAEESPGTVYSVTIAPFQRADSAAPASALLLVDDLTQSEQLRRLELEAANLRLVKTMADRLAHEVGNAMVPLSTHQQLLAEKYKDPEFRASLDSALADGVKRVTRLINQMRFLARDALTTSEPIPLSPLIEEAYQEARKYQPGKSAQLKYENGGKPLFVTGDRAALKYALTEVMINALQANPGEPKVGVRLATENSTAPAGDLQIEVQDNGGGFTPETAQKAVQPFFTTRNVGLGLGLTVTRKIIETHRGKLEIVTPKTGRAGIVRISLPLEAGSAATS